MPIKTAFRRSLLNCQPIQPASQKVVSTLGNKDDGYAGIPVGFSAIVERQVGLEVNTTDAISLTGISDFAGSEKFSIDPERLEIISVSRPFDVEEKTISDFLKLRNFECSLDEADIKTFYDILANEEDISELLQLRVRESNHKKIEIRKILQGLGAIADKIDDFRDEIDFIGSNNKIHQYASLVRRGFSSRFSDDPRGILMSISRTLPNLDYKLLSNSSILQALSISLLMPGCILFDRNEGYNVASSRFLIPVISHDPISDFLFALSSKQILNSSDFFEIESVLPKDSYSKISLLAESTSYELSTTVGLKKAKKDSVFSVLESDVNPLFDIIKDDVDNTGISSVLRKGKNLPFEIRPHTIDGIRYGGVLEGYVDQKISTGDLNLSELQGISSEVSTKIGNYVSLMKKVRMLDTRNSQITGAGIISFICDYISKSVDSLNGNVYSQSEPLQFSMLCEIAKNDTSSGTRARHDLFKRIFISQTPGSTASQNQAAAAQASGIAGSTFAPIAALDFVENFRSNNSKTTSPAVVLQQQTISNNKLALYSNTQDTVQIASPNNLSTVGGTLRNLASTSYNASVYTSQQMPRQQKNVNIETFLGAKDSKYSTIGTTSAILSIFGINSAEKVSSNVQYNSSIKNPILLLASSNVPSQNQENAVQQIIVSSVGSLPVVNNAIKNTTSSNRQLIKMNPAGSYQTVVGGLSIGKVQNSNNPTPANIGKKSTTIVQKTGNILSTYLNSPSLNAEIASAQSADILGTSFTSTGISAHLSSIPASSYFSQVQPSFETRDISQESLSFNDFNIIEKISEIKLLSERGVNASGKLTQSGLNKSSEIRREGSAASNTSQYAGTNSNNVHYYNCFLDGSGDIQNSFVCNSDINSLLTSFSYDVGIAKKMRDCYFEFMSIIDTESGSQNLINRSGTRNFKLNTNKVQFMFFEIFMSILSMTKSSRMVRLNASGYSTSTFDVQSRINLNALKDELDSLIKISSSSGNSASIVSTGGISINFSNVIKSMSYCMLSSDLIFERLSVLEAFYTTYSNSIASLSSIKTNQSSLDAVAKVKNYKKDHLLQNLTEDSISYRQFLLDKLVQNPLSSYNKLKLSKIASSVLTKFFRKMKEVNPTVLTVGLPTKSLESLRRSPVDRNTSVNETKKEYVEIEIFKRDMQFSDIMYVPTKVRFCQNLEVIPLFSPGQDPATSASDFTYMCYIDGKWKINTIASAVLFVMGETGLNYAESIVVVMNHIVDAVCKLANSIFFSNSIDSFSFSDDDVTISSSGYDFLKSILSNQKISTIFPIGDMSLEDFLVSKGNKFRMKKFSEIGADLIDKIDEPTYRLLMSIMRGSIFNYETMEDESLNVMPFERYYSIILSENDYDIDKSLTYSTTPGKVTIDGILREGFAYQDGDFVKFYNDDSKILTLRSREFSARLNLVIN